MKAHAFDPLRYKTAHFLNRFRKAEDGAMIIFSLFMFVMILWLGGMSVDLMRFETTRAKLQGTLDRATLAAADLDQTLEPAEVVVDYFTKAGMIDFLDGVPYVDQGINYRIVSASAKANMPLMFYDIPRVFTQPFNPGLTALTVSGTSTAEERVTDVEVSLVLDVSSSMNRDNRIQNLRPAAQQFVSTVLANNVNAPQGLITVSMIPYSAVVNPGTLIADQMNISRSHTYSTCPLFDSGIFNTTALDMGTSYEHVAHFDIDSSRDSDSTFDSGWCFEDNLNAIIPHTTNESTLHTAIDNLAPFGNTAIDMGVKWGVGLLDPSTRGVITQLAGASGSPIPGIAAGRPYDHDQEDVLKVLVLMTDGENTRQWDLYDRFKYDTSFVWFDMDDKNDPLNTVDFDDTSVQYRGLETPTDYWDDRFYWNGRSSAYDDQNRLWTGRFRNYPQGFDDQNDYVTTRAVVDVAGGTTAPGVGPTYKNNVRLATWQDLYANWEVYRVNNELLLEAYYSGAIPWSAGSSGWPVSIPLDDYIDSEYAVNSNLVDGNAANDRLAAICGAARDEGIIIYTVAFEAPENGQTALRNCASSESHYFDVAGTDIADAFAAIASDIRALKLVQ
ncbi:pilus assembly protein TadG-related protein [Pseudooctadecabacter sp.]|uniref:TadE/TadG family type IV pilus assembly protein n=1 Tax=Pseudooctadecabacter sp. TaxID=1966338 RepID=UPI003F6C95AA